jgi:3-phenylpropionate/trans-cinnamate dioxygenase ferredoxin reductase subunit
VIVVGGGFIGLEVAASARGLGLNVHVVEAANRLMQRAVPPVVSLCFARKFVKEGVAFTMKTPVEDIRRVGTGHRILLRDGTKLDADLIVAGIGAQPNTALAEMAGLEVDGGILVDGDGRTSNRYIFAAGDVAVFPHETFGLRRRLEAWEPALDQAERVAHVMAGVDAPAIPSPWVWSNQFDWNLQMAGFGDLADREIVRGAPEGDSFTVFHIRGAQLVGAVSVNAGRDMTLVRRHLGEDLSEAQLVALPDTTNQLRKVLRGQIELQGAATG